MNKKHLLSLAIWGTLVLYGHNNALAETVIRSYKSGIDIVLWGEEGTDWLIENTYHDHKISDTKTIYLKKETQFTFRHNEANSLAGGNSFTIVGENGKDTKPNTGDEGIIRYRVDKDLLWGPLWVGELANPKVPDSLRFSELEYEPGITVAGTTGPSPGIDISQKDKFYWRGSTDESENEWHTIHVADDDSSFTGNSEYQASDGKSFLFIVDPKTPALTISKSGNAQYYTTPAKKYFLPRIYNQTTYFTERTGDIFITLTDLDSRPITFRINGKNWQTATQPTFKSESFNQGSNILEYYSREGYIAKRTIVKNPKFPSSKETHGNLFWGEDLDEKTRITNAADERYSWWMNQWERNTTWNSLDELDENLWKGFRFTSSNGALINAWIAYIRGNEAKISWKPYTYADYAKQLILENPFTIDPVGNEIGWSGNAIPCREIQFRGYYDVNSIFSTVFAYDFLINQYTSEHHPNGITPIEDYFIRDCLAGRLNLDLTNRADFGAKTQLNSGGMWSTARYIGGLATLFAMPTYSTEYYGTAGLDGNENRYYDTPFPNDRYTWEELLLDDDQELKGYPNLSHRLGIEDVNINSEGNFTDRIGYYDYHTMGHCFYIAANLIKIHKPEKYKLHNLDLSFKKAVNGTLRGLKYDSSPHQYNAYLLANKRFPELARTIIEYSESLPPNDSNSSSKMSAKAQIFGLAWHDSTIINRPTDPSTLKTTTLEKSKLE